MEDGYYTYQYEQDPAATGQISEYDSCEYPTRQSPGIGTDSEKIMARDTRVGTFHTRMVGLLCLINTEETDPAIRHERPTNERGFRPDI